MKVRVLGVPMYSVESVVREIDASIWPVCDKQTIIVLGLDNFILALRKLRKMGKQFIVIDNWNFLLLMQVPLAGIHTFSPLRAVRRPLIFPKIFPKVDIDKDNLGMHFAISSAKTLLRQAAK